MHDRAAYRSLLGMLAGLRSISTFVATEGGNSVTADGGGDPQPDKVYVLVASGPCWVRTDGVAAITRQAPARFVQDWIVFVGEGRNVNVIADALAGPGVDVVGAVEGPLDPELALALVLGGGMGGRGYA